MIVFELSCTAGHRFEGWFASTQEYADQHERELVRCPICDDAKVCKVPSAKVRVGKGTAVVEAPPAPAAKVQQEAATPTPAEFVAALRAMVKSAEDVGQRFPEEARKIHYEESAARSIRGKASREEAEAMRDEGIEFASLPSFLTDESH
ncbi:MAG: DUF1178 family protein [Pseudomonadota bacterium]|nr:DUF1178 family protein [Pseudomonadota bacterium]